MKQYEFYSKENVKMIDVWFADRADHLPQSILSLYRMEEAEAPEYWETPRINAAVKARGYCNARWFELHLRSRPLPGKAVWL